jgi:hypothetical protein
MSTKQQQVAEVVEGLGLGLVALGVTNVASGKLDLELAFSHAWRRWDHANDYPSIGRATKPDNEFWIGVTKSERRKRAVVLWHKEGREYRIGIRYEDWTPEEIADLIGSRPLNHWVDLASRFRGRLDGLE